MLIDRAIALVRAAVAHDVKSAETSGTQELRARIALWRAEGLREHVIALMVKTAC